MKHTHKYIRVRLAGGAIKAKCALPGCPHSIDPVLAVGRKSICNICNQEFILERRLMHVTNYHCTNCFKPKRIKKTSNINAIMDILENVEQK